MSLVTKEDRLRYQELVKRERPARPIVRNTVRAFIVGGLICELGQVIQTLFIRYGHFKPTEVAILLSQSSSSLRPASRHLGCTIDLRSGPEQGQRCLSRASPTR
ncbi:hypothetical protein GCM10025858_03060 [Alicyclobacillus sacchari]|nr:hypothetical protein GCM10025858_03060 [Alicyclobacillus sacchari]